MVRGRSKERDSAVEVIKNEITRAKYRSIEVSKCRGGKVRDGDDVAKCEFFEVLSQTTSKWGSGVGFDSMVFSTYIQSTYSIE